MNNSVSLHTQEDQLGVSNVASFLVPREVRVVLAPALLGLGFFLNLSNPGIVVPVMETSKQVASANTSEFSFQNLNVPMVQNKTVGKKISRQEAFAGTRRILQKAEQARIDAAEIEARYAISWEQA